MTFRCSVWPQPSFGYQSLLCFSILLASTPLIANAQSVAPAAALEPVVISSARIEQPLNSALAPVTLLTRADIERSQATDLIELLGRQSGLQFTRTGGPGAQASLFVRGAGSSQVLVLIDGVQVNSAVSGATSFGTLSLDAVERIEIVRGNLSSLYGSAAIGGVVQIFTRGYQAKEGASVALEAGSGRTRAANGSVVQRFGDTQVAASLAGRRSEPFSAIDPARITTGPFTPGPNPDRDGTRQASGSLRLAQQFGDATELSLVGAVQRSRTEFDSSSDGPTATQEDESKNQHLLLSLRQRLGQAWTIRGTTSEAQQNSALSASLPTSFNRGRFESRNRQTTLQADAKVADSANAQFGAELLEQRGGSSAYDPLATEALTFFGRRVTSGWFGTTAHNEHQQAQLNVRQDEYSDVGSATTGLLSYGYSFTPALRSTLQWSNAFRAPNFDDLYYPFYGNPLLKPERARSVEWGLRYAEGAWQAGLALFVTRTTDLVQYDARTSQAENIARAKAEGAELSLSWTSVDWRVNANLTQVHAVDRNSGLRLLRRAPTTANLGVFRSVGRWELGAEANFVGARPDVDVNTFARKTQASYSLLRALARVDLTASLSLKLRVENLLDKQYTLVDGYNTWGRAVFGSVQWRL